MFLTQTGRISAGYDLLDTDLRDLEVVTLSTGTYLYTTTGRNGGLGAFRLNASGQLAQVIDSEFFTGAAAAGSAGMMASVTVNGVQTLVFGTAGASGLMGYSLSSAGQMVTLGTIGGAAGTAGQRLAMTTLGANENALIYAVNSYGTLDIFRAGATGRFEAAPTAGPTSYFSLSHHSQLQTASVGAQDFLLATDMVRHGVISYSIDRSTGALHLIDQSGAVEGLGLNTPTALEVVSAFGQTWALVASAGSSSLSVMRLGIDGRLEPVDHVLDTRFTRFAGAQSMAVAQSGDRVFIVLGGSDDGLSLFTLLPDGRLLHLQSIEHTIGAGLMNVGQIKAAIVGNMLQVFVSSAAEGGLSQFTLQLGNLGAVTIDTDRRATVLNGTAGDDLIMGGDRRVDTLYGGDGDDILVGGPTEVEMYGGAGRDRFVISESAYTTRIMDFTPGVDTLDLSNFGMLRSAAQLTITPTAYGATITLRRTVIEVHGLTYGPLSEADLFGSGFSWPDRVVILRPDAGELFSGAAGNDSLTGTDLNDTLLGEAGDDVLVAGAGADLLQGGVGNDLLWGGEGDDILYGESGNDTLYGGAGQDSVDGGDGDDLLNGDAGDDTLVGGLGADELFGGMDNDVLFGDDGNDSLWGGPGNDTIYGGRGNDLIGGGEGDGMDWLYGGDGNDEIWANGGNDIAYGGGGNDTVGGSDGNDTVYGDDGDDAVWGGPGADYVYGGAGNDTVGGRNGNDWLFGGDGDDELWSNDGDDVLFGGNGNDTLGGSDGNDTMYGDAGHDDLRCGPGDDFANGGDGDDMIDGFTGDDYLLGGAGNDTLWGADGNDTLIGGTGNDRLWGGAGADRFVFFKDEGRDLVLDFTANIDTIAINTRGYSFASLEMMQVGADTVITLGTGQITLQGVSMTALDAGDFFFA